MLNVKNSLRWKFFLLLTGLGVIISLGVGLAIYLEYDRYVTHSYETTLNKAVRLSGQVNTGMKTDCRCNGASGIINIKEYS